MSAPLNYTVHPLSIHRQDIFGSNFDSVEFPQNERTNVRPVTSHYL